MKFTIEKNKRTLFVVFVVVEHILIIYYLFECFLSNLLELIYLLELLLIVKDDDTTNILFSSFCESFVIIAFNHEMFYLFHCIINNSKEIEKFQVYKVIRILFSYYLSIGIYI